ncbi:MAG: YihA family ribosome biogenesis GTP-binding protein [Proteobacteria bacterium]|nr:YihA family ribosome biogenesis GTP-binding protein [Pseudomonadota bacterium]
MPDYKKTKFATSAATKKQYPGTNWPEVALVGRSNVGKSSLLNMLCEQKNLARVSKTPGRTQLINFFSVEEKAYIVDLPGYGFAAVPDSVQSQWDNMMHDYLSSREQLLGLMLLLDIRRMPSEHDMMMFNWCMERELPVLIILTKTDKVSRNEAFNQLHKLAKVFNTKPESFVSTSALKKTGIRELRDSLNALFDDYFAVKAQIDLAENNNCSDSNGIS